MKTIKNNSRLSEFANELESLNQSEMKELVGGDYSYIGTTGGGIMTITVVATPNNVGAFGGYNSFSDFASSYAASSAASSSAGSAGYSGGGGSSAPSTNTADCVKKYEDYIKAINTIESRYYPSVNPSVAAQQFNLLRANAGRTLVACLNR